MNRLLIIPLLFLFPTLAIAQTTIPGGPVSGTWTQAGSPYLVEGFISIQDGDTLVIEPGVDVLFQGHHMLTCEGVLLAEGTEQDSIRFLPGDGVEAWAGLELSVPTESVCRLSYCLICGSDRSGIFCDGYGPLIEHCTIAYNSRDGNCGGGIWYYRSLSPTIRFCTIIGNWADDCGGGIMCLASSPIIESCLIEDNHAASGSYVNLGGGICCYDNSHPEIRNCDIIGNSATHGGGIDCKGNSNPLITSCYITDNVAGGKGGGIRCWGSTPTITDCIITGGSAEYGGGICCRGGSNAVINDCIISNNTIYIHGGGIYCSSSSPNITNCIINDNIVTEDIYSGGGICCEFNSNPTFTCCSINNNSAYFGGGVSCEGGSSPSFLFCTVSNNSAFYGGGFYCHYNTPRPNIINCTLDGNSVIFSGGGIYCDNAIPIITNTVIKGSNENHGVYLNWQSLETEIKYCDIYGYAGGAFSGGIPEGLGSLSTTNANGDSCDAFYNIYLDPLFVDPDSGDYHLLEDSPCIDAGDPASPCDPDSTIADIGAFYYHHDVGIKSWSGSPTPPEFALTGAYPNPFNPATTLRFDLPRDARVHLAVYDIAGRLVATLADGWRQAGSYETVFDAAGLASGVYLYRLEADEFTANGKMLLLK